MKIERLYTLSQFVDELTLDFKENESWMASAYLAIHRYVQFLKQPLTKEMFVCDDPQNGNVEMYDVFDMEQKKVIFEDIKLCDDTLAIVGDNLYRVYFNEDTLLDVAQRTAGKLKLKNVEL